MSLALCCGPVRARVFCGSALMNVWVNNSEPTVQGLQLYTVLYWTVTKAQDRKRVVTVWRRFLNSIFHCLGYYYFATLALLIKMLKTRVMYVYQQFAT